MRDVEARPVPTPPSPAAMVSFAQRRLWILSELYPESGAYNTRTAYAIHGDLDVDALRRSLEEIVRRHEALRTTFDVVDGELVGRVVPASSFPWTVVDLSDAPEAERDALLEERLRSEGIRRFDLRRDPPIRALLFRIGRREHVLLLNVHHIAFDELSKPIFNRELAAVYAAFCRRLPHDLAELPIQYRDFARRQRDATDNDDAARQLDYWRAQMHDAPARIDLPVDRARPPVARFAGAVRTIALGGERGERIQRYSREHRVTPYMTMLAVFYTVLYRYTGQRDLVVATPVANRMRTELEPLIGFFVNTLALRVRLSGTSSFGEVLDRVRETAISAFDHQDLPFERLVEALHPERSLSAIPLVNAMFFVRQLPEPLQLDGLRIDRIPVSSTVSRFDVSMRVTEEPGGLVCSLQYDTDLFYASTIDRFLEHFTAILDHAIAEGDDTPIARIPMLGEAERRRLVVEVSGARTTYPAQKTLPELFADQARRTPHAIAVVCGATTLTYAQLDETSERVASKLAGRGVGLRERVGLSIDRSAGLVVGLLAILKHRCAFVALDPALPQGRLAFIARDANLTAIVTRSAPRVALDALPEVPRIDIDASDVEPSSETARPLGMATDVAYVTYTSGSTGTPNGVEITHRSLVNLLVAMRDRPGMTAADTLLAVTTASFDMAYVELFLPLVTGARIAIASNDDVADGRALRRLLERTRATVMQATPATWQLLVDAGWEASGLRSIWCGGDVLSRPLAEALLRRTPDVWNLYGPTETTIYASAARVEHGDGPVSIGSPIANTQLYVLGENGELLPPGVPGELCVGGDGVALGYVDRPELNARRFVTDSFGSDPNGRLYRTGDVVRARDDRFEFLGRRDHQIKLRGFRIELGEVESALRAQSDVADAAAILVDHPVRGGSIRAFVTRARAARPDDAAWLATLRGGIAATLPRYMVPATIVVLDALPRTPSGKIDRSALPQSDDATDVRPRNGPVTAREAAVLAIVEAVLGREGIEPSENLFDAGLHSVSAVGLMARLGDAFGIRLPLHVVFEHATVAGLARALEDGATLDRPRSDLPRAVVAFNRDGTAVPFFFLHNDATHGGAYCRRLAAALGASQPLYAIAPHGTAGLALPETVEAMALDYYRRIKTIVAFGPYRVGGFCTAGTIAFALAQLMRERGDAVEHLVIVNKEASCRRTSRTFDALIRRVGSNVRLGARLRYVAVNALSLLRPADCGPSTWLRVLGARIGRALTKSRASLAERSASPLFALGLGEGPDAERNLVRLVSSATYHPDPYDGGITLVWSSGDELEAMGDPMRGDPTIGWGAIAGAVRIVPIAGDHHSPIRERVDELGRLVAEIFEGSA